MASDNKAVDFRWSKVVIGSDPTAVQFATENNAYILFNREPSLHSYEESTVQDYVSLEDKWAHESYGLYNSCYNPFTNLINSIRVDRQKKTIKVHSLAELFAGNLQDLLAKILSEFFPKRCPK